MPIKILQELNKFNKISFNEEDHSYYYDGDKCRSVTSIISNYKEPFNTLEIAKKYAKKHGLETEYVIEMWDENRILSANKGSELHKYLELKFACKKYTCDTSLISDKLVTQAEKFYSDVRDKMVLIRAELVVGDREKKLCGMLDKLFYNEKYSCFKIWDYKTNTRLKSSNEYNKKMINGLDHLEECEINTYSLQLGLYKKIIESNSNIKIDGLYLCWLNENNDNYKPIKLSYLEKEVDFIYSNI